jgi:hypothetical protein
MGPMGGLSASPKAGVERVPGRRLFRYQVRYRLGVFIPERSISTHMLRRRAMRAARRWVDKRSAERPTEIARFD